MTNDTPALGPPPRPDPTNAGLDLGDTLVRLRGWAGLTQAGVATRNPKLSSRSISEYEKGSRVPKWEALDALVRVYLAERGLSLVIITAEVQDHWLPAWRSLRPPQQTRATPRERTMPPVGVSTSAPAGVMPAAAAQLSVATSAVHRGRWVLGGVGAAAVVAVVAVMVSGGLGSASGGVDAAKLGPPTGTPGAAPSPSPGVAVPGGRFPETVNTPAGARTYSDPYNLIGEGPRITNGVTVEVACVLTAPSAPSVGDFWYLIVDEPWGGRFYSPANAFLNGDPPEGGTTVVDPAVPACPPR